MSLLDDVSLMITPNGVAENWLFGVLPEPTLGAEIPTSWTNKDFSSFSSSGSNITQMISSGSGNNCYSTVNLESGKTYRVRFTSSQALSNCQIRISPNKSVTSAQLVTTSLVSGLNEIYFTTDDAYTYIGFYASAAFSDTQITDFTLKEYTTSDMDFIRATTATRSAYSVEKIINGNFESASNWTIESAKGWSIDTNIGAAVRADYDATNSWISQSITIEKGVKYKISYERTYVAGTGQTNLYSDFITDGANYTLGNKTDTEKTTLTITDYFTPTYSGTLDVKLYGIGNFEGRIENLSVTPLLIEDVPRNLLENSQDFSDGSWSKQTGTVVTPNQAVAPDGTMTAYKVVSDGSNGIFESSIYIDGIAARSVYLRSITGTLDVILKDPNVTPSTVTCSLTTTWQRFELIQDNGNPSNLQGIWVDDIPADGIYMWGAQLEKGSQVTPYIRTIDRVDIPRIDYTGGGCPHVLSEPQRENICLRSEELEQAIWSKSNGSTGLAPVVTAINVVSPDGNTNADKVVFDLDGGGAGDESIWSLLMQDYTSTGSDTYTISCYVKGENGGEQIIFDVDTQNSNVITLTTDWVRYSFSRASTTSGTRSIRFGSRGNNAGGIYGSDNPTVYMWGFQLEIGSYETSYIPTRSTSVTRNADVFTRTGIGDLIGTAGVLYLETASIGSGVQESISLSDGTTNNRVIFYYSGASSDISAQLRIGAHSEASGSHPGLTGTDFHKIAIRYQDDSFQMFIDGVKETDVSGTWTVPAFDRLLFDYGGGTGGSPFYGKLRNLQLYKTALTEAKCISLTT